MKTSRLLAYGALGIIVGLLAENTTMRMKERAACKAKAIKKKAQKLAEKVS